MKQLSSMITGAACTGSQYSADAHAARKVDVSADLRAGADRGPRVDHRARVHVGADIDVRGHEDRSGSDVGAVTRYGVGHGAHAQLFVAVLKLHLVVPLQLARFHFAHGLDREIEDDGLLDPFVHLPLAFLRIYGLRRAQLPLVHQFDGLPHGLPHGLLLEQLAVFPSLPDYLFQFAVHNFPSVFASQSYAKTSIRRPNYLIFS